MPDLRFANTLTEGVDDEKPSNRKKRRNHETAFDTGNFIDCYFIWSC